MSSPIDGQPMRQIMRYGIEFDVCSASGGIWLDKGELEKLITLVREEVEADRPRQTPQRRDDERARYRDDDDDDRRGPHGGGKRSRLSDLFDF
jgi:Zn-finger nucleic acid-binding protein